MKIVFAGTTIADTTLDGHHGLRLGADFSVQAKRFLRATAASFEDRGSLVNRLSWSVSKSHASYQAADEYFLEHAQTVSGKGDCVFTTGQGGATGTKTLAGAVLKASARELKGMQTVFDYTLEGGLVT